jgi:hypothetical protein
MFLRLQTKMAADLECNRDVIDHPGLKGDACETRWLKLFDDYLPSRYVALKACAIDSHGNRSEQLDVVIIDRQYCPLLFSENGVCYAPAESVYAVFEVKQTLHKDYIEYAGEKAASVRRLHRTSIAIPHAGGVFPPKALFHIPAGILTLTSDWSPPLGEPFESAIGNLAAMERLDLGCAIHGGAFACEYCPTGTLTQLDKSAPEVALITFFLTFLSRLQTLGTVPALDFSAYLQAVVA